MKVGALVRWFAALLMLGFVGLMPAAAWEDGEGEVGSEYGVGLYLGNCDSLVAGAALFDLGNAELETEVFENADENLSDGDDAGSDVEDVIEDESSGDETAVEDAIGGGADPGEESDNDDSDQEVVVQDDSILIWVSIDEPFGADLAKLVEAPFAVAVRDDAADPAETGDAAEVGESFIACGTFGGAVAGNQLVISLRPLGESRFTGVAILERGEADGEGVASVYLFRDREGGAVTGAEASPAAEPTAIPTATEGDASAEGEFGDATPAN